MTGWWWVCEALWLVGMGLITAALGGWDWLTEPKLPQQRVTVSKADRKRLTQRGQYMTRQIKKACIGLDLCEKTTTGQGQVRYRLPRLGGYQCVVGEESFHFPILQLPPRVTWRQLNDGRLIKELSRALRAPVELIESPTPDDVHRLVIYDRGKGAGEVLPAHVAYDELLPLPQGLRLPLGLDAKQQARYHALTSTGAPHILVGGSTGSGKSVLINCWLTALVTHHTADEIHLYLIDLKQIELAVYQHLPHVRRLATTAAEALDLLDWLLAEVQTRYALVSAEFKGGIPDTNVVDRTLRRLPRLVLVIDELAELTLTTPDAVTTLIRLGQIARAAKVNIIAATQRPSVDVVPGTLKTNFDVRVALALPAEVDSRVILDKSGAELLTPPGQAIYRCGVKTLTLMTPLLTEDRRNALLKEVLGQKALPEILSQAASQTASQTPETASQPAISQSRLILQAIETVKASGERVTVRRVYEQVRGQVSLHDVTAALKVWRTCQRPESGSTGGVSSHLIS